MSKPWTDAEQAAGEAFTNMMVELDVDVPGAWVKGGGPGKFMRCIRAALAAAGQRGEERMGHKPEYGTPASLPVHHYEITFEDREGTWTWIRCHGSFHGVMLVALAAAFERGTVVHHITQLDAWRPDATIAVTTPA